MSQLSRLLTAWVTPSASSATAATISRATSPNPARNRDFGKSLAKALWRPFLPFGPPDVLLDLVLGEVAQVVTKGQRVLPTQALRLGYAFRYPELEAALREIYSPRRPEPAPSRPKEAHAAHH